MTRYNVLIIGAGPAGSYLAYKLKKQGISILLLEKQKFPRYKACAGGLSKKAFDIIFSENKNIENIVEKVVRKGLYVRNNRFTFVEPDKELVYMTYRSDLDNFLMKMAVDNQTVFFKDNVIIQNIDQNYFGIPYLKGIIAGQKKKYEDAISELKKLIVYTGNDFLVGKALLGYFYGIASYKKDANKITIELKNLSKKRFVPQECIALPYLGLGDIDNFFKYLEKSYEDRTNWPVWLLPDPKLDPIRSDPRYLDLLNRLGLDR